MNSNDLSFTCSGLGHIAGGMSSKFLRLWANSTDFSELLQFVSRLPGSMRPALVRNKLKHAPSIVSEPQS